MSKFIKKAVPIEMVPYVQDMDMTNISIGNGIVPEVGGFIASDPNNLIDKWYLSPEYMELNYEKVDDSIILTEPLMTVKVSKNPEGRFVTRFIVHSEGGTINEFIFGTDEDEAKGKTNHLVQNILLGLEYVQGQVREAYGDSEDGGEIEAIEEPK